MRTLPSEPTGALPHAPLSVRPQRAPLLSWPFALLLGVQLSYGFVFSTFLLLPKYLAAEHHAKPATIGQLAAVSLLASVLSAPPVGWAIGRMNRGVLIVVGALLGGSASVAFASLEAVGPAMFLLRVLQGIAFVLVFNSSGTLAADNAPSERLGQTLGLWGLAMLVTNAIAPGLLEPLAAQYGWVPVFASAGLFGLVAAGLGTVLAVRERARPGTRSSTTSVVEPRRSVVFLVVVLLGAGLGTAFTFIPPFALERGIDQVRPFFIGYTIAAVAARMLLGGLGDRWGHVRIAVVCVALYALALGLGAALSPRILAIVGAGIGLAHGLAYPGLNAVALENAAPNQRGTVMAYYNAAFNVGFAASTAVLGPLAGVLGYSAVFAVVAICVGLGVPLLLRLPERRLHGLQVEAKPCHEPNQIAPRRSPPAAS